jgi:hypothetical protein
MSRRLSPDAAWRAGLLAVLVPVLVLGFGASGLANRLVFAGWGLAVAAVAVPVLRRSVELWRGRPGGGARIGAAAAFTLAPALALFGLLAGRHHEVLDLGVRAVLPGLYTEAATEAGTYHGLAILLLVGAVALRVAARRSRIKRKEGHEWPRSA